MYDFKTQCGLQAVKGYIDANPPKSRIYGFILYSKKHPFVLQALRDTDIWNALNEISGSNWPIFAVRPLEPGISRTSGSSPYGMSFLVETWEEPTNNYPVLIDFGLQDSKSLPLFVAFMWDDNDELHQIAIPINAYDKESVFHSLEEIVGIISKVETAVPEGEKNTVSVFNNVKKALTALKIKHFIIERGKIPMRIAEFLGTLGTIVGFL